MSDQLVPYWNATTQQCEGPGLVPSASVVLLDTEQATAASATQAMGIATRSGIVADARVAAITPLTGNATYTVDIHKNGVTILSAPIALLSTTSARASVIGTLTVTSVAAGDFFEAVIVDTPGSGTAPANIEIQVQLLQN